MARVDPLDPRGNPDSLSSISTCGYSVKGIVAVIIVGSVMFLALICNGCRRLSPDMPLLGSSSLAISAACHRPSDDASAALKPIQWGAVRHETVDGPGHCCFTSFPVEYPIEGQRYAGYKVE